MRTRQLIPARIILDARINGSRRLNRDKRLILENSNNENVAGLLAS